MKKNSKLLRTTLLLCALMAGTGTAWADNIIVNMQGYASGSGGGYVNSETQATFGGVTFMACGYIPGNGQIRGNKLSIAANSNGNFQIYNTTAIPGSITRIELKKTSGTFQNHMYAATGSSSQGSVTDVSVMASATPSGDSFIWTFAESDGITYFKLCSNEKFTNGTVSGGQIIITYSSGPSITPVTSLTLSQTEALMTMASDTLQLTATVLPSNATDRTVTWSSSNPAVATVTNDGKVIPQGVGTAIITATATNGTTTTSDDLTATCTVTVNPAYNTVSFAVTAAQWVAISSPVNNNNGDEDTSWVTNLTSGSYDLFGYDEEYALWRNAKNNGGAAGFSTLTKGLGYIYRRNSTDTLHFNGDYNTENVTLTNLSYTPANGDLAGWHLVGNPFNMTLTTNAVYYSLSADGAWVRKEGDTIQIGEAILIYVSNAVNSVTFDYAAGTMTITSGGAKNTPALPKGFCLGGNNGSINQPIAQPSNLPFALWNGDQLEVTIPGTLEAYDMMGRRLFIRQLNCFPTALPATLFPGTGVYVLRLDGMSQKIVIR